MWFLVLLAAVFALANGVNDGGAIVASGLKVPVLRPIAAIALLSVVLALGPVLVGTAVAQTIARQLITFHGGLVAVGLTVAVGVALGVVLVLAWAGLPTSLTLALVGAIAGTSAGLAQPVPWTTLAFVLVVAALAPVVGAALSFGLIRGAAQVPRAAVALRRVRGAHLAAFTLLALAYAANDGQKMFAVLAVATGMTGAGLDFTAAQLVLIAASFALGAMLGVRRAAGTLVTDVLSVRPPQAVSAEFAAAAAVLGSAALGAPVSMTQSTAGGIIGAGMSDSLYKVRWRAAGHLALAWVVTLPAAFGLAALLAAAARLLLVDV